MFREGGETCHEFGASERIGCVGAVHNIESLLPGYQRGESQAAET